MNRKAHCILALCIFLMALLIVKIYTVVGYDITEPTILMQMVNEITANYRLYQIVATILLFFWGWIIAIPLCSNLGTVWCYVLALPIGNAMWGVLSAIILFLNIPYNRFTMLVSMMLIVIAMLILFKNEYKKSCYSGGAIVFSLVLGVTVIASTGILPIYTSHDSYYFVMQYGQLLTKMESLAPDVVGTYMTWTGVTPALISSYAAMWGFENIYAIHYLLVFSMYGFVALAVYRYSTRYITKIKSELLAIFSVLTIFVIPAVSFLSTWIIANTYFMIYIVFVAMLPVLFRDKMDDKLISILALFLGWLALSRMEGALIMCFFIICISSFDLTRKHMLFLYLPVCVFELLFLVKVLYENSSGMNRTNDVLLTKESIVILLLALLATAVYIGIYNWKIVVFVRKHLTLLVLIALILACVGLGLLDINKLTNNLNVIAQNFCGWWFRYILITILIIELLKSYYGCRNKYFDLIVWGFILCTFAVCMGRTHYLRVGIGDSYNRMCMSIIPLYVITTVFTFIECFGKRIEGDKGAKRII